MPEERFEVDTAGGAHQRLVRVRVRARLRVRARGRVRVRVRVGARVRVRVRVRVREPVARTLDIDHVLRHHDLRGKICTRC